MFTGIVEKTGMVLKSDQVGFGMRLVLKATGFFNRVKIGGSIAVNGVCLTLVKGDSNRGEFEICPETLEKTNLALVMQGEQVNLEKPMTPSSDFSGHFVQGHVDGVGEIISINDDNDWKKLRVSIPPHIAQLLVPKGSIALDGVSLTVANVKNKFFEVALIPHTLAITTLKNKKKGDIVNLEGDVLGKYVLQAAKTYFINRT